MTHPTIDPNNEDSIPTAKIREAIKAIEDGIRGLLSDQRNIDLNSNENVVIRARIDDLSRIYVSLLTEVDPNKSIAVIEERIYWIEEYNQMVPNLIWDRIEDLNYIKDILISEFHL